MVDTIIGGKNVTKKPVTPVPAGGNGNGRHTPLERVGVGILGCGYWGVNYVRAFTELPEARVVAVCDEQVERLTMVADRVPAAQLTTKLDEMLELDELDVVVVCTPAQSHYQVAQRCLEAGKHVLVEKPLTTRHAEAETLDALAKQNGLVLMVGHTFIYNPGIRKVKDYVETKEVGDIYYLYARRTNLGPIRHDVNALWDLAAHDVSIFNYLLDATPEWASAVGARVLRNGNEDVGFVVLGYPDGTLGHLHVSWADPNKVREVVVVGSDRRIVFNDLDSLERVRVFDKGVAPSDNGNGNHDFHHPGFVVRDGDITSPAITAGEPLKIQCAHFVECVTSGRAPLTGAADGAAVVRVMEAIDRSLARRGAPVRID